MSIKNIVSQEKLGTNYMSKEPMDDSFGCKLYQSSTIKDNYEDFLEATKVAYTVYQHNFLEKDSTKNYNKYNLFSFTANSVLYYNLFKELSGFIRDYIGDDRPLWMESWINFHKHDEVLELHSHYFAYHGYISVDPKNTTTIFPYVKNPVENKIGQIYIGPGGDDYAHYVKVNEPYEGTRVTIGFDISPTQNHVQSNLSFIPII